MLNIQDEMILKTMHRCVGKRIVCFSSSRISWTESEISFPNRQVRITFFGGFNLEIRTNFFESENGETYYDYEINQETAQSGNDSTYYLETDTITKIEVFGRAFSSDDFRENLEIWEKYKGTNHTDDLFTIHFDNGEKILIVMNEFIPTINLYVGSKMINYFFSNTASEYELHHTL